jgi:hypothetical protein
MDAILKYQLKKKKTVNDALKFCRTHQYFCFRNIDYVNNYINAFHGVKRLPAVGGGKKRKRKTSVKKNTRKKHL